MFTDHESHSFQNRYVSKNAVGNVFGFCKKRKRKNNNYKKMLLSGVPFLRLVKITMAGLMESGPLS